MKDTFSSAELTALRNDLIHDTLIDSREAAELLQLFLMGRGFGASPEAARDAVGRRGVVHGRRDRAGVTEQVPQPVEIHDDAIARALVSRRKLFRDSYQRA